ncbi:MAG TPA: ABC transporter permease [Bryobacteraceae bacterium]|jgi:ribose transport system permease protein|nr:ABC transporter permease [Bryobacteraceae bacterium]
MDPHRRQLLKRLQSVLGLVVILILAIFISPKNAAGDRIFLEVGNLTDILRQAAEIGVIALGMTLVILSAGIDLSVGSTLALSATVTAMVLTRWKTDLGSGMHILVAILAALAACGAVGAINGVVIVSLRIQPFIVTLATMIGIRGLARRLTDNTNIDLGFGQDVSSQFAKLGSGKALVVAVFAILAIACAVVLGRTVFGRRVKAVGDNERAALYAGLPIKRTRIWVYTLCGLLAGVAGVLHAAQNHQGNPNAGMSYELDAIAAVVIGGTSLSGGQGSIAGTVIGTLITGILTNMLRLNNVDSNTELMLKAVIIVAAVWIARRS